MRHFHLIVGQSSSRENGNLLSSGNAVHAIDSGDAGLDHFLRVDAALRVNWLTYNEHKDC